MIALLGGIIVLAVIAAFVAKKTITQRGLERAQEQQAAERAQTLNRAIENLRTEQQSDTKDPVVHIAVGEQEGMSLKDQEAGTAVILDSLVLSQPGFIAIHEAARGGALGTMRGTSIILGAGVYEIVSIAIAKPLQPRTDFIAALYRDDGDGAADISKDKLLTTASSTPLTAVFKTLPRKP